MSFVMAARTHRILLVLGLMVVVALALPGSTEAASFDEIKKLIASDPQAGDFFGISVAISGDTAVVGAQQEDAWGDKRGRGISLPA